MPNLENLRKQAKLYVRWHRDRYYPVAAQIRAVLPRFRDLTDRQALDRDFRLSGRRSRQECRPCPPQPKQALRSPN
jgi:hypothetical protein